jgi:hypothetical protein
VKRLFEELLGAQFRDGRITVLHLTGSGATR